MGFTTDLLTGVAQLLDTETDAVWDPYGVYGVDQIGIVLGIPTQSPDSLIALAAYGNIDDPALADSTVQVQVRLRGPDADPRPADDLADAVFDALQGKHGAMLGPVRLVYARRSSTFPLGIDGNGRQERSDNYNLAVHRPSPHRD